MRTNGIPNLLLNISLKDISASTGSTLLPKVVQIDRLPGGCHGFCRRGFQVQCGIWLRFASYVHDHTDTVCIYNIHIL